MTNDPSVIAAHPFLLFLFILSDYEEVNSWKSRISDSSILNSTIISFVVIITCCANDQKLTRRNHAHQRRPLKLIRQFQVRQRYSIQRPVFILSSYFRRWRWQVWFQYWYTKVNDAFFFRVFTEIVVIDLEGVTLSFFIVVLVHPHKQPRPRLTEF